MTHTIRAFIAIELSPEVKSALADLVEKLRRAHVPGLRLVRPEGIHLTLKFLGNVPEDQVEPIVAAVSRVAQSHRAIALELGDAGAFPNQDASRVLWVGVEGDLMPLVSLQKQVDAALASLGFARDKRDFSPHLTVARIRDGTSSTDRRQAAEALLSAGIGTGFRIEVSSVSLIQSTLLPDGAVYDRLATMPLAGGLPVTEGR